MLISDGRCFVCGRDNDSGLHLEFSYGSDGLSAETTFLPGEKYQGWQGIVHGGIIIAVLDEVMAKAAVHKGYAVVTGEITVKLKNPAKVLEPLRCRAVIEDIKKRSSMPAPWPAVKTAWWLPGQRQSCSSPPD